MNYKKQSPESRQPLFIAFLALMILAGTTFFMSSAHAAQSELSSQAPTTITYKINDGYGEYVGTGSTKLQASEQARESCIMRKVEAYERKTGQTPDTDTADMFFDACINK
jgi:hypothetical protein